MLKLTPDEVHIIAHRLNMLKRGHRKNGIHWETVKVFADDNRIYLEWEEDQGGPYLQRVPCSEFILEAEQ